MEINAQIAELEAKEAELMAQGTIDHDALNAVRNKLAELRFEIGQQQAHEERVSAVVAEFNGTLDSLDFGGMSLRQIVGGESEYELISITLKKAFMTQAENFSKQIADAQATYNAEIREAEVREERYQKQLDEMAEFLNKEKFERADAEAKRDAAVAQLTEAKKEIEQLKSWNDDLRQQIALGVQGSLKVVNTEEEERKKQELVEKLKRERTIFNKRALDIKQSKFAANLALTGEEITFTCLEEKKFFVIPESEVSQFRLQYGADVVEQVPVVAQEPVQSGVTQPEVQFPTFEIEEVPAGSPMAEGASQQDRPVVGEEGTVSRAEFEALKADVETLKRRAGLAA